MSDELPSALRSIGRSLRLGHRAEPLLIVVAGVSTIAAAAPDPLFAFVLAMLADAVVSGGSGRIGIAAGLLAVLAVAGWLLRALGDRANRRLAERAAVPIESHVARLHAVLPTLEHVEQPDYADRLAVLRDAPGAISGLYQSLFSTTGAVVRLVLTVALLMSVRPILGLLGVFAIPTVLVSNWRGGIEERVKESVMQPERLARHLFVLATEAGAGKEIRISRMRERLRDLHRTAWTGRYRPLASTRWKTAVWQAIAFGIFGAAFVVAILATARHGTPGRVLLVVAAGSRLSAYIGQTANDMHFFRVIWLDVARRMTWLEDLVAAAQVAKNPAPQRIRRGIELRHVSFRYPGTDRFVLDDITLELPPSGVVAIVGHNGAGKTTLVKLLAKLYEPTTGGILVDGDPLAGISAPEWRSRVSGAFQDFFQFEFTAQRSVGVGDLSRIDDRAAVSAALDRAGAGDFVGTLDAQLGVSWTDGVELSHGQWQRIALARGLMRDRPLLLVLDEPTSAVDAETEHALFERYAAAGTAQLTILVSHRFSTVRMADLIVVLDGARLAEFGSHDELMSRGGQYCELYTIQAAGYR
jgi:ATP-binding cassette subfamily B protein